MAKVWNSHVTEEMCEQMGLDSDQVAQMVEELDDAVMNILQGWGLD